MPASRQNLHPFGLEKAKRSKKKQHGSQSQHGSLESENRKSDNRCSLRFGPGCCASGESGRAAGLPCNPLPLHTPIPKFQAVNCFLLPSSLRLHPHHRSIAISSPIASSRLAYLNSVNQTPISSLISAFGTTFSRQFKVDQRPRVFLF